MLHKHILSEQNLQAVHLLGIVSSTFGARGIDSK